MALLTTNTSNKLTCNSNTGSSIRAFVVDGSSFEVVQGSRTLAELSMKDFSAALTNYSYEELTLAASSYVDLSAGNIAVGGEVKLIVIVATFPRLDSTGSDVAADDQYLDVEYPVGGQAMSMGKIMVLSGSSLAGHGWTLDGSPGGLRISNAHANFDVTLRVLMGS